MIVKYSVNVLVLPKLFKGELIRGDSLSSSHNFTHSLSQSLTQSLTQVFANIQLRITQATFGHQYLNSKIC